MSLPSWPVYEHRVFGEGSIPLSLGPLVERLHDSSIHRGDDVHGRVQFLFRYPCFPWVRKAPFRSGFAVARHRNGKPDEHLLPLAQAGDAVRLEIELPKIGFVHGLSPFDPSYSDSRHSAPSIGSSIPSPFSLALR